LRISPRLPSCREPTPGPTDLVGIRSTGESSWRMVGPGMTHLILVASFHIMQSVSLSSSDMEANTTISLSVGFVDWNYWLSQANHIFKHLGILSNFEDYGTSATSSWSAIEVDLPRQLYWRMFDLTSAFPRLQQAQLKASCFSAHPMIFKLDHLRSNGRSVQPIGPWIHSVPTHLAGKMQRTSASPPWNSP
jgi:hypothetical protein